MNRLQVQADAEGHSHDKGHDIMQALGDILAGKKPVDGRARMNRQGVAHGNRIPIGHAPVRGAPARIEGGLRPAVGIEE